MPRLNEAKTGVNAFDTGNVNSRLSKVWNVCPDSKVPKSRMEGVRRVANPDLGWRWCKNVRGGEEHMLDRKMICEKDINVFGEVGSNSDCGSIKVVR